jgi:hypothetical protein
VSEEARLKKQEQWAGLATLAPDESLAERDVKDPWGFDTPYVPDPKDPWGRAKKITEDLIKFLNLLRLESGLTPVEVAYAQELMALNTFNLADVPEAPAQIAKARKAAFEYYSQNR